MLNIKALRPVIHEKNIFKGFCYINLIKLWPLKAWPFITPGLYLNKSESPSTKDVPC